MDQTVELLSLQVFGNGTVANVQVQVDLATDLPCLAQRNDLLLQGVVQRVRPVVRM